jgi:hypothetical protein
MPGPQEPEMPPEAALNPEGEAAREEGADRPFRIVLRRKKEAADSHHFTPYADLILTPALRTSGLLRLLPAEEAKSLLMALTFLTANGNLQPSVVELAQALDISEGKVRQRMGRLTEFVWRGRPLARLLKRESGADGYALSDLLFTTVSEESMESGEATRPYVAASREAVISHSRMHHTRPREVVEREIAQLNGWPYPPLSLAQSQERARAGMGEEAHSVGQATEVTDSPDTPEQAEARRWLLAYGIVPEQADLLLTHYNTDRISRQVAWLPYRKAKNPASLLIAAIESDYEEPLLSRNAPAQPKAPTMAPENADEADGAK